MTAQVSTHALALTLEDTLLPLHSSDLSYISWTEEACAQFSAMLRSIKLERGNQYVTLPFVSLREHLNLHQAGWGAIDADVGLKRLPKLGEASPFGYLLSSALSHQNLHDAISGWLLGRLTQFIRKHELNAHFISRLQELLARDALYQVTTRSVCLSPWHTLLKREAGNAYTIAATEVARKLVDVEIFPELGPVYRVIGPASNSVELMTLPHFAAGGYFSLVCTISIETLPRTEKPVIYTKFSRRRWATEFHTNTYQPNNINGYVISQDDRPGLAFGFYASYNRISEGSSERQWQTNEAYDELITHLGLLPEFKDERVVHYPKDGRKLVLIKYKSKITDIGKSTLDTGVPLTDQYSAFERIRSHLEPCGMVPFVDFEEVKRRNAKIAKRSMLKSALVLAHAAGAISEEDLEPDAEDISERIHRLTKRPISEWVKNDFAKPSFSRASLAKILQSIVCEGNIYRHDQRNTIWLLVQNTSEVDLAKSAIHLMFGDTITVEIMKLPEDAHGPNLTTSSSEERTASRTALWKDFCTSVNFDSKPMVLIQAAQKYEIDGSFKYDDQVNKPTARRTLSTTAGATVQYLLPMRDGKLGDYLLRLQAAVLDLIFGHGGHALGINDIIENCFASSPRKPQEIAAIGSVSLNPNLGKARTVLAAVRINPSNGRPLISLAHMEHSMIITKWMPFDEGLRYVAERPKIALPTGDKVRFFFQQFAAKALSDIAAADPNAVVFIDSTRHAKHWPYLRDRHEQVQHIEFDAGVSLTTSVKSLRLIRVREQSPTVVHLNLRKYDDKGEFMKVPTSVQRLLRVKSAQVPTYWSIAKPITKSKRGVSCYRSISLPKSTTKPKDYIGAFKSNYSREITAPDFGQHSTPNGTEFSILYMPLGDDADLLASFAHQLRAGIPQTLGDIWVKLPAPLHIIGKLRDYMS